MDPSLKGGDRKLGPYIKWGIDSPLDLSLPNELDGERSRLIEVVLRDRYETPEGYRRREETLNELRAIVHRWAVTKYLVGRGEDCITIDQRSHQEVALHTFGSYKLGVVTPTGDIDCCVVVCLDGNTDRSDYFTTLSGFLQNQPGVEKLVSVEGAFTPLIKFAFNGIDIDMLLSKVRNRQLVLAPDSSVEMELIEPQDHESVRSINGVRCNSTILKVVPNTAVFKEALKMIKHWATVRGVYANVLGFFGGITWAILVAWVCQMHPNYGVSQTVCTIFHVFSHWNWRKPVSLCDTKSASQTDSLRLELMPIITPAYPSMNSTHNVSKTTAAVITAELRRASRICAGIEANNSCLVTPDKREKYDNIWDELIEPYRIFNDNEQFLFIEIYSVTHAAFQDYCGYLESRLRLLIKRLEVTCSGAWQLRPWPESLYFVPSPELIRPLKTLEGYKYGQAKVIGLSYEGHREERKWKPGGRLLSDAHGDGDGEVVVDLREAVAFWLEGVKNWPGSRLDDVNVNIRVMFRHRRDLPSYCRRSIALKD
eukprot:GHVH01004550.1.p1 GENE.GHVH01004550.1~~GHVH01004550.1.p1  ORF type:complete len:539 (+),score=44.31 GHVH01004550.1:39-1655(+)